MSSEITSLIAFSCMFGGAIFGIFLHSHLPEHHLTEDSKHVVNLGAGVIGTMAALVLGLLVASAKSNYDTQNNEVLDVSAKLALLDGILAQYGPPRNATVITTFFLCAIAVSGAIFLILQMYTPF